MSDAGNSDETAGSGPASGPVPATLPPRGTPAQGSDARALVRRTSVRAAPWAGLAHLWMVLGLSTVLLFAKADAYGPGVGWLLGAPQSWLIVSAALGAVTGVLALLSGQLEWPVLTFAALLFVWTGSGAVTSLVRDGHPDMRSVYLALACGGLALGVATVRSAWSGWSFYAIGVAYVWLSFAALYINYYSLGAELQLAGRWWSSASQSWEGSLPSPLEGWPNPAGALARPVELLRYLVSVRLEEGIFWRGAYVYQGLAGNGNLGGNFLAPLLAFSLPFALGRGGAARSSVRALALRVVLAAFAIVPGLFLLVLMDSRTAVVSIGLGVIAGSMRCRWLRSRQAAAVAAVGAPLAVLAPVLLVLMDGPSWSGRACVWESWFNAVRSQWALGLGPPARMPVVCSQGQIPDVSEWWHAHNELLQAWSLGGLVGLAAAIGALGLLAWFAVRHGSLDDRALLVVLTCCLVLMGLEVLSTFFGNAVHLGIATLIAVGARSLALMSPEPPSPSAAG